MGEENMNIQKAKHEFINYTNKYNMREFQIKRKLEHSLRVMEICETIAKNLELNQEEQEIATIIGLLHDIARFEQYTKYKTFNDRNSFDHGNKAVEILKENNYIRNYIEEDKYDDLIYTAIQNHNKFQIKDGLTQKEQLYAKIIRDADKLDILYQGTYITWHNSPEKIEEIENAKLTPEDIQPFIEKRQINRAIDLQQVDNNIKHLLTQLGFVFDINFKTTYQILKETNYMNKIINRFNFKDQQTKDLIEQIRNTVNEQIETAQPSQ